MKKTFNGYILKYRTKNRETSVLFNQYLFGRLSYQTKRGKKYCYYLKGMLHKTKFKRIKRGTIFILDDKDIDLDLLKQVTKWFIIQKTSMVLDEEEVMTGLEYWKKHAQKHEVTVNGWGKQNKR